MDKLLVNDKRVLLINSYAYDLRLPWHKWHQPIGLLRLGAALRKLGCDVRFEDLLTWGKSHRIPKQQAGTISIQDTEITNLRLWRIGAPETEIAKLFNSWNSKWSPEIVYISCGLTTWWAAAKELIQLIKARWQEATVVLGGAYPTYAYDHAKTFAGADQVILGPLQHIAAEVPDLRLYRQEHRPRFAGIHFYHQDELGNNPRSPDEIATEIKDKAALGVTTYSFFDSQILPAHAELFSITLEKIASLGLTKTRLVVTGNISPKTVTPRLARALKRANCRQVYLHCDVLFESTGMNYLTPYEIYKESTEILQTEGGFTPRTDQITAMCMIGAPYENIEYLTERLIRLASIVGAVNLVQYQHTPSDSLYQTLLADGRSEHSLTYLNCKLYPLGRATGVPFAHYVEITRLAALLNSKYRSKTFNFMGDSFTAQLMQNSLKSQSWSPKLHSKDKIDGEQEIIQLLPRKPGE